MNEVVREPRGLLRLAWGAREERGVMNAYSFSASATGCNWQRRTEREATVVWRLPTPRGRGACPRAEGGKRDQETDRLMEWVIAGGTGRMGNKCFLPFSLPPSFISGRERPSSIVWRSDVSQNSCPDYGSRERERAGRGGAEWAAWTGCNICFTLRPTFQHLPSFVSGSLSLTR